jgi:hypothetical protein
MLIPELIAIARVIEFYLAPERSAELEKLRTICARLEQLENTLATSSSGTDANASTEAEAETALELVRGYVREGMRLSPAFAGVTRVCGDLQTGDKKTIVQGGGLPDVEVRKGDVVFASFVDAAEDVSRL